MSDIGDLWRAYRKYVVPHIRHTREKRFKKFHGNFDAFAAPFQDLGIKIKKLNYGEHIQLRFGKLIANYYPRTRSYFVQKPQLSPTERIDVNKVIERFLNEASKISGTPLKLYVETKPLDTHLDYVAPIIVNIDDQILKFLSKHPEYLYRISPRKFEELIARILGDFGFDVELTKATRDAGRDILAYIRNRVCSILIFVECKRYAMNNPVGVEVVRSVYGIQRIYRANKSLIVTTSYFTKNAKQLHRIIESELELKDYEDIKRWLIHYA